MAIYRQVRQSFWTDAKIVDDFTPEDRYFYLYLMTNPHTNLCGCYELSFKSASDETGYNRDKIEKLIERLEKKHNVIRYSKETKELLIIKWHEYNWTNSPKFRAPLENNINDVKNPLFKGFLMDLFNGIDTVSIPYSYGSDTTVSVSVSDTVSNTVSNINNNKTKYIYYPNDPDLDKAFSDYVEMRKKIKAPLTDRAIELAMSKLQKLSGGDNDMAIEILNQSIEGSWKGLYELHQPKGTKTVSIADKWQKAAEAVGGE